MGQPEEDPSEGAVTEPIRHPPTANPARTRLGPDGAVGDGGHEDPIESTDRRGAVMSRGDRVEPEVEQLWEEFHRCVNVSSEQLRSWLLTEASGEEAFRADPDLGVPEPGRQILAVLGKRKVDLTPADVEVMRRTVAEIRELVAARPVAGAADEGWRHALLDLGHDPLAER